LIPLNSSLLTPSLGISDQFSPTPSQHPPSNTFAMLAIDGTKYGGQLVRNFVITAAILFITGKLQDKIVRIENVRGARPDGKRGMKHSLFGVIHFVQAIIKDIKIEGLEDGSPILQLDFANAAIVGDLPTEIILDAVGSGSAWLLFLAVHPMMLFLVQTCGWRGFVKISGGTDVWCGGAKKADTMTPPTEYIRDVTLPNVDRVLATIGKRVHMSFQVTVTRSKRFVEQTVADDTYPLVVFVKPTVAPVIEMHVSDPFRPTKGNPDAAIKTGASTTSPFIIGIAHPSSKFELPELDLSQYMDVRFSDQYILYWTAYTVMGFEPPSIVPLIQQPVKDDHLEGALMVLETFGLLPAVPDSK
jgi:hypothetical protein